MDRVQEIEAAIDNLSPDEFERIAHWFRERDQAIWDRQLDADAGSHKLDFLFDEADDEARQAHLRNWPPAE